MKERIKDEFIAFIWTFINQELFSWEAVEYPDWISVEG